MATLLDTYKFVLTNSRRRNEGIGMIVEKGTYV